MLRRGDSACFDNVDTTNIPEYTFTGLDGERKTTHLYPGPGSIRYDFKNSTLRGFEAWAEELEVGEVSCGQDACFGALTHGFAIEEEHSSPRPTVLLSQ
jgi:hypothetical protein